jgi:MSHA biogenesis protein MshM
MYLEHFGLKQAPFKITPHTEFFFSGANRGTTLDALRYAVLHGEGLIKVTGEVGTGKTMLCRTLAERLPDSVETIFLAVPSLTRDEILHAVASDLKLRTKGISTAALLEKLQEHLIKRHASGRQVVILIDEAHAMPLETLEQLRLLSNLETNQSKLLQIVLFGQPELDVNLRLPHMRQIRERITHSFVLTPLPNSEISEYLTFRLRAAGYRGPDLFSTRCVKRIAEASVGLTRRVNILADKTLLAAFADGTHSVETRHVIAAIRDCEFSDERPGLSWKSWLWGGSAALVVALTIGALILYASNRAGPKEASNTTAADTAKAKQ